MYAIETDLGRFEADTEKEAKKALRAAQRRQDAIDAEENRKAAQSRLLAGYQAYCIYERKGREAGMPCGWRYKTNLNSDFHSVKEIQDGDHGRGYSIETEQGRARVFPYSAIVGYVENGAGFCMAVSIEKQDCELFAVGVFEGRAVWLPLYGISISEFNRRD